MMTIFGTGSMAGGPVAGWLMDTYGWPISFWVQVSDTSSAHHVLAHPRQIPVVLFCATIVTLFVPEAPIPPTHRTLLSGLRSLDWLGTLLLIGCTTTLILGLSFHTSYLQPWSAPVVWGNLTAAILACGALIWVEGKVKRPLIPLELFADRHTASIMASGFFLSVVAQAFVSF
jgi:MFS family permease